LSAPLSGAGVVHPAARIAGMDTSEIPQITSHAAAMKRAGADVEVVQSQTTSCPPSTSQAAAVAALTRPHELFALRRTSFQARLDLAVAALHAADFPGLEEE